MAHPLFHIEFKVRQCGVRIRLNDFEVAELAAGDVPSLFAPPVNPYLVGDLNVLDVTLLPFVSPDGEVTRFGDAEFSGVVRRYEKGDIVEPGVGDVVTEFGIPDELREQVREEELELPQSFSHVFSNDVIDFTDELSDPPPIADESRLLDYAIHLRDLIAAGDVPGLMVEMESKAAVWVRAYDEPLQAFRDSLQEELEFFLTDGPEVDFERDDVELVPCCGGRVWELRRASVGPLLRSEEDADGARTFFSIFVGQRDGALRVVR